MNTPSDRRTGPTDRRSNSRVRELISIAALIGSVMMLIAVLPITYNSRQEIRAMTLSLDNVSREVQDMRERVRLVERKVYLGENPTSPPPAVTTPPPNPQNPQNPR